MAEITSSRPAAVSMGNIARRISWSAVFAGVVLAGALQLLLNLLGLSIGLWTMDVDALQGFGIGAGIWWLLTALVALYVGGWVAGHLAGVPRKADGLIHGLLVWSLGSLVMVWFVSTAAGALIGGATSMLGRAAGSAGSLIEQVAPGAASMAQDLTATQGQPMEEITSELRDALTGPEAEATRREMQALFTRARQQNINSPQFRQEVVDFMVNRGGVERGRAQELTDAAITRISQARQQLAEAGQEVKETSEDVAHSTGRGAFWAFLALLAGAIAAALGGRAGTPLTAMTTDDHPLGAHGIAR